MGHAPGHANNAGHAGRDILPHLEMKTPSSTGAKVDAAATVEVLELCLGHLCRQLEFSDHMILAYLFLLVALAL